MLQRLSLPELKIASPCPARWGNMRGDDRQRFCESCGKHVHNFAAMRDAEIAALLDGRPICAQLYRRADGTILTADCPVGSRLARTRAGRIVVRFAAASFALFASTAAAIGGTAWGTRILATSLNATIGKLQAAPLPGELQVMTGGIALPATQPATQPIRGQNVARPTMGIVALPASRPTK